MAEHAIGTALLRLPRQGESRSIVLPKNSEWGKTEVELSGYSYLLPNRITKLKSKENSQLSNARSSCGSKSRFSGSAALTVFISFRQVVGRLATDAKIDLL